VALVEAAPDFISHNELIDKVWGEDRVIKPENLTQRIMLLRNAIGDDANAPRYTVSSSSPVLWSMAADTVRARLTWVR
jgi:DNA-binding winged helix-turn-helix (wHTH) protein